MSNFSQDFLLNFSTTPGIPVHHYYLFIVYQSTTTHIFIILVGSFTVLNCGEIQEKLLTICLWTTSRKHHRINMKR